MLAAALAAAVVMTSVLVWMVRVRTDMVEFLPAGRTEAARLVLAEARAGSATGLILIGIEGAPVDVLAQISKAIAATLRNNGLFAFVAGGDSAAAHTGGEALFTHRYLLADADFSEAGLQAALGRLVRQLQSSMAPLAVQFGFADPVGAFGDVLRRWGGASTVRQQDGAWFAADRDRALLLARTRAGGMDIPAQEAAAAAIQAAFDSASSGGARLLVTGPAVFAKDAARVIKADVERISLLSTTLIVLLLWWRFRRLLVIAAMAIPILLSIAAAALAVQLGYGAVHGVALGFGITMLGISVDYPVLMIGHRKRSEPAMATRARIGRAFVLAVLTAALGLSAMVFSGFPGLSQLGVFSATGLLAAAAATWWLLPRLIVAADLAPVSAGNLTALGPLETVRRWRWVGLVPVIGAILSLGWQGGPAWDGDLQNLSPVPAASRALDTELRAELGAGDVTQLLLVRGPDPESVLRRQEALLPLLDRLAASGVLTGADVAARLLPSTMRQEARRAALPSAEALETRLGTAGRGLPFRAGAFDPFLAAVAASRNLPVLRPDDLAGTPLGSRLEPLLYQRDGQWHGPIPLHGLRDPAQARSTLAGQDGVVFVDMRQELSAILADYMAQAWRWLGWSGLAVLAVLVVGLRDAGMVVRVMGAVAAALLVTVALLALAGARLTLIHLIALQLVAGVSLDYALFFARRLLDEEERARTLRTLVTCNAMTLLTFGLLAFCDTPLLRDIGVTVAVGAVMGMGFSFLFAGEAPARPAR